MKIKIDFRVIGAPRFHVYVYKLAKKCLVIDFYIDLATGVGCWKIDHFSPKSSILSSFDFFWCLLFNHVLRQKYE